MKRRLTSKQRKIIAKIKRLYRKREPLNITAVKREHPKLIKSVYDVKPFWGWKRALEDAGIDYSDIKVELLDYVVCEICGIERCSLNLHLTKTHGTNKYEYWMDYPDADILCEELRARMSTMKSAVLPHWEPLWTREYVMDRIMAMHTLGIRLNNGWVLKNEQTLLRISDKYFDGWHDALKAVGLDVSRIRINHPNPYEKPKDVLRELRRRTRLGLPVNYDAVTQGEHADGALHRAGISLLGSWKKALQAVGVDPEELTRRIHRQTRSYPDKKSVIGEIERRREAGLPSNTRALWRAPTLDVALWKSGSEYFGSWRNALRAAGIDPDAFRRDVFRQLRHYPDEKSVIKGIRKRRRLKLPLNMSAVCKGTAPDDVLWRWGRVYFGSWDNALCAAGVDPVAIRSRRRLRRYPSNESVISGIKKRRKAGLPLNPSALYRGPATDTALWKSAREYFGSWEDALSGAGAGPRKDAS